MMSWNFFVLGVVLAIWFGGYMTKKSREADRERRSRLN